MTKINISNPFVYWSIVFLTIFIFVSVYQNIKESELVKTDSQVFEKQSYDNNRKLDIYEFPDINVKLESENNNLFLDIFKKNNNLLIIFLLFYSIALSMLFTFRERSRISKEMLDEKLKIEKERMQSKINIFEDIEVELKKYENILSPEMKLENLDKRIDTDTNYVLFNARVVLEKILLNICKVNEIEEEPLNKMIYLLFKKEILTHQTKSYAHTIKAFGNRVAHPSIKQPIIFTSKDALLVLSTLVALLEIFKTQNLLVGLNNDN
jgi:hypothetical protein